MTMTRGIKLISIFVLAGVFLSCVTNVEADKPPAVDKEVFAYWDFDGEDLLRCSAAEFSASAPDMPLSVNGLYGKAVSLNGSHQIMIPNKIDFSPSEQITIAAWIKPTDVSSFRDIIRKEDENRLLLAIFHNGHYLSFGLNINGYVECWAQLVPTKLVNGYWHHVAGVFDGQNMYVYFDGIEIKSIRRPGKITLDGLAKAFIGSASGGARFFQGDIDEMRIYKQALTAEEIKALYEHGKKVEAINIEMTKQKFPAIADSAVIKSTFAESLAATRAKLLENNLIEVTEAMDIAQQQLYDKFGQQCDGFYEFFEQRGDYSSITIMAYLTAKGNAFNLSATDYLIDRSAEYMPITEDQWKRQSPQQLKYWKLKDKYEQLARAEIDNSCDPAWVEIMVKLLQETTRPSLETVAPFVKPSTIPAKTKTAVQAKNILNEDWLFQADNNVTSQRIQNEINWARQLAERIADQYPGKVNYSKELSKLSGLEESLKTMAPSDNLKELYFTVRNIKRRITFANPVVDFDELILIDNPYPQGSEWQHEARHLLGYMAVPGGKLLRLKGLNPDGKVKQIMPSGGLHGFFWRPDVSYDGKRIIVGFKPANEKSFHIYEVNTDGTGLRQVTDSRFDDFYPIYLPDGKHFVFTSTRGHSYVRCMPPTNSSVLCRADLSGENVYIISRNDDPDYTPSMLSDGRVIYTRWEYTDKPLWRDQSLWTVNPDGTGVNTFWGNQTVWPDLLKDAREIPGSRRVMFTGSAHHNWFAGCIGIIDPVKGLNFPNGLTKVTADLVWPESGDGPVDPKESANYHVSGRYDAYYSPYPLSEKDFLVSARRDGKFRLYLMDTDGNRELIYEGDKQVFYAIPLKARKKPPVVADRVEWPTKKNRFNPSPGVIYSNDVYQGAPESLRGKAKYVRILRIIPKTYTYWAKRPYMSSGPVVSMVQADGVKKVVGTVPIEKDGSFAFNVPSGKAVHFQLLDEEYRALQTMRSFTGVMPGENRGCLGCHELHSKAPMAKNIAIALNKAPRDITPPPWGDETVGYERFVQPAIDKYCGSCHQGDGKARKTLDLTLRGTGFQIEPYMTLIGRPNFGRGPAKKEFTYGYDENGIAIPGYGIAGMIPVEHYSQVDPVAYATPEPLKWLSYGSPLAKRASSGEHHGVKMDKTSLRKLYAWIDAMCPIRGEEEIRAMPDPAFKGKDFLAITPRIKSAPYVIRPGPVDDETYTAPQAHRFKSHAFIAADYSADRIVMVNKEGRITWTQQAPACQDVWYFDDDTILYSEVGGAHHITLDKKVIWEFKVQPGEEIHSCQLLDNGNYMVAVSGPCVILEIDKKGAIQKTVKLKTEHPDNPHTQMRQVRKFSNGNYFVGHYPTNIMREYDGNGKIVSEIKTPGQCSGAIELPGGGILVVCGDGHALVEYDKDRNIIWQLNEKDLPGNPLRYVAGAQRLANGNTVVFNWGGHGHPGEQPHAFEVTPDKKVVWQILDTSQFTAFSHGQILNEDNKVTKTDLVH